jgi:hypothetical protein
VRVVGLVLRVGVGDQVASDALCRRAFGVFRGGFFDEMSCKRVVAPILM